MVLTTPLFYNLKRLYPDSHISVICNEYSSRALINNPNVNRILLQKKSVLNFTNLFLKLKQEKFDFYIDINPEKSSTSNLFRKVINSNLKLGYSTDDYKFDINLSEYLTGAHYTDISTSPIKYLNEKSDIDFRPQLFVEEINPPVSNNFIFVNVSSGKEAREWEVENYIGLISILLQEYESDLVINCINTNILKVLKLNLNQERIFYPEMDFDSLCNHLKRSNMVISPDTSIVHISSVYNIPIVVMFNNVDWNIKRFYPMSEIREVIISEQKNTLEGISPSRVMESVSNILGGNAGSRTRVRNEDH